jgi:hypothetical protein
MKNDRTGVRMIEFRIAVHRAVMKLEACDDKSVQKSSAKFVKASIYVFLYFLEITRNRTAEEF